MLKMLLKFALVAMNTYVKYLGRSRGELVARLHRSPAYLERRAVLASLSVTSGTFDGLSRCHPARLDGKRSQADIPGTHQVGMEGELTVLAHKEQPVLGTVLSARVATARTSLTGVVGIDLHTGTPRERRLIRQQV